MEYQCDLCDGWLKHQTGGEGIWKCLVCHAEYRFDEGLVVSTPWVKAEIKRLRDELDSLRDASGCPPHEALTDWCRMLYRLLGEATEAASVGPQANTIREELAE